MWLWICCGASGVLAGLDTFPLIPELREGQLLSQRDVSIQSSWMLGWLQHLPSLRSFSRLTVSVRHFLHSLFLELLCCSQGSAFVLTNKPQLLPVA